MLDALKNFVFGRGIDTPVAAERAEPVFSVAPAPSNLTRMLEAASPRRGWGAPVTGNSVFEWSGAITAGLETVKQRSRHASQNNSWYGNGTAGIVDATIGTGFVPNSMAPDTDFRRAVAEAWSRFVDIAMQTASPISMGNRRLPVARQLSTASRSSIWA